jgi:DNA-binding CsgD family transcriptional regulator
LAQSLSPDQEQEWPFVGRTELLGQLAALVFTQQTSLVLAGSPGVGKTRLATELLERAGGVGYRIVQVTATRAAREIPFGSMTGLLVSDDEPLRVSGDDRTAWLSRCVKHLASLGGPRPLVLLIDDIHLLDSASATLVHEVVKTGSCLLLATMRTGETAPDPIVALYKNGHVSRLDVDGVGVEETEAILQAVLGDPVESSAVLQFAHRSEGNLLYLRELVRGAMRSRTLIHDNHLWRLIGRAPLSARLIELIEARLQELTEPERNLVELVAYGEPLDPHELTSLACCGEDVVETLETRGFLASRPAGRRIEIRMAHPVYADALLHRLSALRRQRLARSLADLADNPETARPDSALRAATWCLEGGLHRPELMLRAAASARWNFDFGLAERLARAAADDGAGFEAELLCAQLAYLQGRSAEAETQLAAVVGIAADDSQRTRVALAQLECAMFLGKIEDGIGIATQAEQVTTDPELRSQITARRAGLLLAATGPAAAVAVATPLLKTSQGPALVWACTIASVALGRLGRLHEATTAAEVGYQAHLGINTPMDIYPWLHLFFRGDALLYAGDFAAALSAAKQHYTDAVDHGSIEAQAYFGWQLARSAGERGEVEDSVRYAREAEILFRELGRPALREQSLVEVVVSLALSGRRQEAQEALAELDGLHLPRSYYAVEILRARAWAEIANGSLADARHHLEQAVTIGERIGDHIGALDALHTLARLGHAHQVSARATRVASHIEGRLAKTRLANIRALEARDWRGLETAARSFAEMGAHLLAAEAATEALVTAQKKSASTQQIAILRRLAAQYRQKCSAAVTPTLQTALSRVALTPAEAEAAHLAASGLSNRRIAEKLCLSARTVEGQLQRSYEKLCITGRSDLTAALAEYHV